jgi:hypothetical protein
LCLLNWASNVFCNISVWVLSDFFPICRIFCLQNENINGHYKNVKFMCADVTSPDLNFSEGSVDLIFSNWLLMYLSDKEVNRLDPYSCLSCLIVVLLTDLLVIHLKASWNQWSVLWWSYWSLPHTFPHLILVKCS